MENVIHVEFFDEKSSIAKHVYFLYTMLGGFCYETYITTKFKYLSRFFVSFAYLTTTVANVIRFKNSDTDFHGREEASIQIIFVHLWIAIAVMVYLKRDDFHALLDNINQHTYRPVPWKSTYAKDEIKIYNVESFHFKVGMYSTTWIVTACLGKLLQKFATLDSEQDEFRIDYDWDFLESMPSINSQTVTCYILVYTLSAAFFLLLGVINYGGCAIPMVLSVHLRNQTSDLQNDMKYHTDVAFECFEEYFRREQLLMEQTNFDEDVRDFQLREIAHRRDRCVDEFMYKVHQWIGIHQKYMLYAKHFKKCAGIILTTQVVSYMAGIIATGYHSSKMILDSEEISNTQIFYLIIDVIAFLMVCAAGEPLREASEDLPAAIYSMPWYYLPKKHQKTLLNFMCLAQKSNEIRIFNILPLSLEIYPTMLNDAYGYVQLMRVFEMKSKR